MIIEEHKGNKMAVFKRYGEQLISEDQALWRFDPVRLAIDRMRHVCGMPPISSEALQKIKSGR